MALTENQRHILLHMTGLDRSDEQTRRHFCTDPGSPEWPDLMALVEAGMVQEPVPGGEVFSGLDFFYLTAAGVAEARRIKAESIERE